MKKLLWILVVLLAIACVAAWFRPHEPLSAEIRRDEDKDGCQGRYDAYLCTDGCVLAFRAG